MNRRPAHFLLSVAILGGWSIGLAFIFKPVILQASMHEQLIIDTRAMALGNAVTADPPDIMSIHYNPAGLSKIAEDSRVSISVSGISIKMESRFKTNAEWENFLPGDYQDPLADTSGEVTGIVAYIPIYDDTITLPSSVLMPTSGGISHRSPGSKWTFALGLYSPLVGGFAREGDDNPLRYGVSEVYWQHLIVSPSVSYKLSPTMSLGLAVGIGSSAMGMYTDTRLPNHLVAITDILGDATEGLAIPPITDLTLPPPWFGGGIHPYQSIASLDLSGTDNFAPSFNLGFLWDPSDWLSFGIVYHSEINQEMSGNYNMSYSDDFQDTVEWLGSSPLLLITSAILGLPTNPVASQTGAFTTDMTIPQMVQGGIRVKPFKFLSILCDLNWAQWSARTEDRMVFDQDMQALQFATLLGYQEGARDFVLKRNLEDSLNFGIGLEITPLDWLTLRLGYEKRLSSVSPEYFDTIWNFPDWDCYSAGLGIGFKNGLTIDLAASYLKSDTVGINVNESAHMNNTEFTNVIYNPYAGLDYEQNFDIYLIGIKLSAPTSLLSETAEAIFEKIGNLF